MRKVRNIDTKGPNINCQGTCGTRSEPRWLADDITWQAIVMTHHEWYSQAGASQCVWASRPALTTYLRVLGGFYTGARSPRRGRGTGRGEGEGQGEGEGEGEGPPSARCGCYAQNWPPAWPSTTPQVWARAGGQPLLVCQGLGRERCSALAARRCAGGGLWG